MSHVNIAKITAETVILSDNVLFNNPDFSMAEQQIGTTYTVVLGGVHTQRVFPFQCATFPLFFYVSTS